jgi:hypothetical protein
MAATASTRAPASATYDGVALEYYFADLHPTCALFREASRGILLPWLCGTTHAARIWETGAGRSLVAESLLALGRPLTNTVLTDALPAMLAHSRVWEQHGPAFVIAAAEHLPVADAAVDALVASLGDPYNSNRTG